MLVKYEACYPRLQATRLALVAKCHDFSQVKFRQLAF